MDYSQIFQLARTFTKRQELPSYENSTDSELITYLPVTKWSPQIYTFLPDGFHGLPFFFFLLQALIHFCRNSGSLFGNLKNLYRFVFFLIMVMTTVCHTIYILALCTLIFAFILHWFTTVWSLFSLQLIKPPHCYGNMLPQVNSRIGE